MGLIDDGPWDLRRLRPTQVLRMASKQAGGLRNVPDPATQVPDDPAKGFDTKSKVFEEPPGFERPQRETE